MARPASSSKSNSLPPSNSADAQSPNNSVAAIANATTSRRGFIGTTAAASAALSAMVHSSTAKADETQELRIAVVGCGGRGSGAIDDSLSINENIKFVATADLDPAKCENLR